MKHWYSSLLVLQAANLKARDIPGLYRLKVTY